MDTLLARITRTAIDPALEILPRFLDSDRARVLLLAIGLQESRFEHRRQLGNGPARGLWQFERGSKLTRGGVWGVYLHPESMHLLHELTRARNVGFDPVQVYEEIERDDVLAAGVARLLIRTDRQALPDVNDEAGAWRLYAERCWRPGKPHPETWAGFHERARAFVMDKPRTP